MLRLSAVIKPDQELESYQRCELFQEVYRVAQTVKGFKARHKLTQALEAQGITLRFGDKKIWVWRKGARNTSVTFEIYLPWKPFATLPQILEVLEEEKPRYEYKPATEPYGAYLYNGMKDVENALSGEMTEYEFKRRCHGLASSLRELADQVALLNPENYRKDTAS